MADFSWSEDDLFIDTLFPLSLSTGATISHEFQTLITRVDNGFETRNPRWNTSLRLYTLRTARSLQDLEIMRAFFVVMRGRQRSFRFKDFSEYTSSSWGTSDVTPNAITPLDQNIGTGDGSTVDFQIRKQYTVAGNTITRNITKPVDDTVRIAVAGSELVAGSPTDFVIDYTTGIATLSVAPSNGQAVTAGFEFDVPVRFDTDILAAQFVSTFELEVPQVVLREVRNA
jgi:uncharacterized protein (TIGR02217 family)